MKGTGSLSSVKNLYSVMRELSLEEIREDADRPPSVLIVAERREDALALAENLTGLQHTHFITTIGLDSPIERPDIYDAIIIYDPNARPESKKLLDRLSASSKETAVVAFLSLDPNDAEAARTTRAKLMNRLPDRATSFGRHFPAFRPAAVKAVIDDTAIANAQFALLSNIPTVLPILGSMAAATADFLVLTKNQLLLVFKVAAIHERDLHDKSAIVREMVPVVGAGLFWRTLAREAAAFIPFAAGTVPKVIIAYSGTVAVGRGADYYYRFGEKPSRDLMGSFYRQGVEALKRRGIPFRGGNEELEAEFRLIEDNEDEPKSA